MEKETFQQVYNNLYVKRCIFQYIRSMRGKNKAYPYTRASQMSVEWMCKNGHIGLLLEKLVKDSKSLISNGVRSIIVTDNMVNDICKFVNSYWLFNQVYHFIHSEMDYLGSRSSTPFVNICSNLSIGSNDRLKIIKFIRSNGDLPQQEHPLPTPNVNNDDNNGNTTKEEEKKEVDVKEKKEDINNNNNNNNHLGRWKSVACMSHAIETRDYQLFKYLRENDLVGMGIITRAMLLNEIETAISILDYRGLKGENTIGITESLLFILGKSAHIPLMTRILSQGVTIPASYLLEGVCTSGVLEAVDFVLNYPGLNLQPLSQRQFLDAAIRGGNFRVLERIILYTGYTPTYDDLIQACTHQKSFDIVRWICENMQTPITDLAPRVLERCIENSCLMGTKKIVVYLLTFRANGMLREEEWVMAAVSGHEEILELNGFLDSTDKLLHFNYGVLTIAAFKGYLKVVEYIFTLIRSRGLGVHDNYKFDSCSGEKLSVIPKYHNKTFRAIEAASYGGHLDVVQYIRKQFIYIKIDVNWAFEISIERGNLDLAFYFLQDKDFLPSDVSLITACEHGYDELVTKIVGDKKGYYIPTNAMNIAATNGYIQIVNFLHNRKASCTTSAMDGAAENGILSVVQYLHYKRNEGCTIKALSSAIMNNDLDMVKFLHDHRREEATLEALDYAYAQGYKEVLGYIIPSGRYMYSLRTFELAAKLGDMDMIQYLIRRNVPLNSKVIDNAAEYRHLDIIKYIIENYKLTKVDCSREAFISALGNEDIEMLDYLLITMTDQKYNIQATLNQMVKRGKGDELIIRVLSNEKFKQNTDVNSLYNTAIQNNNEKMIAILPNYITKK